MASSESQSADLEQLVASPSAVWLLFVILVGGALGALISLAGRDTVPADLMVWAAVAVALTSTAGVVAASGLMSWLGLRGIWPPERIAVYVAPAVGVVLLMALFLVAPYFVPGADPSIRGTLLIGVATLGGIAPMMSMTRVRTIVWGLKLEDPAVVDSFISLRLVLGRQLRGLGALVALATLALAASPFLNSTASGEGPGGGGAVLVLGGFGSAIVAVAYVPVALTLRNRVGALTRYLFPLHDSNEGNDPVESVLQRLRDRQELARLIMGERGIYDELLASLVVAGPLLAAAIGNYVTG